jgi:hypothetical protein
MIVCFLLATKLMIKNYVGKNDLVFFGCKTGDAQIEIPADKPYGLTINMGRDDVSVVAIVYKVCKKPVSFHFHGFAG